MAGVTVGSRNTCYRPARYGLTRTGLAPVGLHQLLLAPSEIQASALAAVVGAFANSILEGSPVRPRPRPRLALSPSQSIYDLVCVHSLGVPDRGSDKLSSWIIASIATRSTGPQQSSYCMPETEVGPEGWFSTVDVGVVDPEGLMRPVTASGIRAG